LYKENEVKIDPYKKVAKPVPEFKSLIYNGEQRQLNICEAESIQSLYGFDTLWQMLSGHYTESDIS
jgi:hypothetical protein